MSETLKEKTSKGLFWSAANNIAQQLLNLVFGIFLARLLSDEDYGMIGMITIFSVIAGALQDSGFITALINKRGISQRDYNAVFWFNISVSALLYVILFFCAPLIALFFKTPELTSLARLAFLSFVISSFGIVPRASLLRHLKTKEMAISSTVALVVSGSLGLLMAYNGMAYWGIATQNILFCFLSVVLNWYFSRWKPSFSFDFTPLKEMIGFSFKVLITNIFTNVNNNLFSILFGRFYTKSDVGNYTQANKWGSMGYSFITGTIQGVAQPVLTQVNEDKEKQCAVFRKLLRFTAFISFPVMLGISLVAQELIVIAITQKWLVAADFLRILAIDGAFIPIAKLYSHLIISKGKSNIYMWNTIAICLFQLAAMLLFRTQGVYILIGIFVAIDILWLFSWHYFASKIIDLKLLDALKDTFPFAAVAALAMGVAFFAAGAVENIYLVFAIKVLVGAAVYIGTLLLLDAKILKESIDFLSKKKL